jgi:hypothetical protein
VKPLRRTGRCAAQFAWLSSTMLFVSACATWQAPTDTGDGPLRERALSQERSGVRLSAAVLGSEDSLRMFGADVTKSGVQPVWIEVRNDSDQFLWLLRSGTDPDYFSPLEVAWAAHVRMGGSTNARIDELFDRLAFSNPIPAHGTSSGILFTNAQPVTKLLIVDLLGTRRLVPFTMLLPVPGEAVAAGDLLHAYRDDELARYDDPEQLRMAIEALPCCATTVEGGPGDPLNVVVVGALDDVAAAANRRGYRRALDTRRDSQQLFGRPPDLFVRKTAQAGSPANWLRAWRAPISYRGQVVFLVQAGRPVGGRFADEREGQAQLHPDVDEARNLLIQDFMYSGGLQSLAFASGVGAVPRSRPRPTDDGEPYFTDGLRAVLFIGTRPLAFSEVEILDWEPVLQDSAAEAAREAGNADQ